MGAFLPAAPAKFEGNFPSLAHNPRTRPVSQHKLDNCFPTLRWEAVMTGVRRAQEGGPHPAAPYPQPPPPPPPPAQIKQQALCKRSMLALLCNPRLQESLFELHAATIITFAPPFFFSQNMSPLHLPLCWVFQA